MTNEQPQKYEFILSYGTGKDLIPVGCFWSYRIRDCIGNGEIKENPLTQLEKIYAAYHNKDILFANICNKKPQIIALSPDSCTKIFSDGLESSEHINSYIIFKTFLDEYSSNPEKIPHITGIPMEEANAKWCTDEDLGYNYSIIPFKKK